MVQFIEALLRLYAGDEREAGSEGGQAAGQGLVEYALVLLFIAIFVIIAVAFFGERLTFIYSRIANSIPQS